MTRLRSLLVPATILAAFVTSASATFSRGGVAARTNPLTCSVGRSLRLWTAMSTSPARTAA